MRLFLDTANLEHIRHGARLGVVSGVTTNPSLVSKEGKVNYKKLVQEICSIVPGPVSTEVISLDTSNPPNGPLADGASRFRQAQQLGHHPTQSGLVSHQQYRVFGVWPTRRLQNIGHRSAR